MTVLNDFFPTVGRVDGVHEIRKVSKKVSKERRKTKVGRRKDGGGGEEEVSRG